MPDLGGGRFGGRKLARRAARESPMSICAHPTWILEAEVGQFERSVLEVEDALAKPTARLYIASPPRARAGPRPS